MLKLVLLFISMIFVTFAEDPYKGPFEEPIEKTN